MSFEIGSATNAADLLNKLNTFLTTKGKAYHPSFTGAGTGTISAWDGGASSVAETFTITATSSTSFTVVGSISGNIGTATVGTQFVHAKLTFLLTAGGTAFTAGDAFLINTASPWISQRAIAGDEMIWMAKGNDDQRQIFVGAKYFSNVGGDYYNWRLQGMTGYNSGSDFFNQPGTIGTNSVPSPILPMWNTTIPYWFIANGQRVTIFVKIGTVYESTYLGLINTYVSPGQWSYPLLVGGSMAFLTEPAVGNASWKYSNNGVAAHSFWRGNPGSSQTAPYCSNRLRIPDGSWTGFNQNNTWLSGNGYVGLVWPYGCNNYYALNLRENLDGSYPLTPIVYSSDNGAVAGEAVTVWGELDGIKHTTGQANASENTITEGFLTYVVFQDIFRTVKDAYCAVALD